MLLLFAAAVGLAAAGLTGSLWSALVGGPSITSSVLIRDGFLPLRVLVLVLHAPVLFIRAGMRLMSADPWIAVSAFVAAGTWCFFQGVFILTSIFGVP